MFEHEKLNDSQKYDKDNSLSKNKLEQNSSVTIKSSNPTAIIQRIKMYPQTMTSDDAMVLQKTIGNQAFGKLMMEAGLIKEISKSVHQETINKEKEVLQDKSETLQKKDENQFQAEKDNRTGLPDNLKAGVENLSGIDMSQVRVYYNSVKPAQVGALAYTQGTNIHVAQGQEKHLPHEAWHVVQQLKGKVLPTLQLKGVPVNDNLELEQEADVMGEKAAAFSGKLKQRNANFSGFQAVSISSKTSVIQGEFAYAAAVHLTRGGQAQNFQASHLKVASIFLPDSFRPPSQYGDEKAHAVSWTLLKKAYTNVKNKPLDQFITQYLIPDWEALRAQKSYMQVKGQKLNDSYAKLNHYLDSYTSASLQTLATNQEAPLVIHEKVQKAVSDYFIAIQLAPLTTHTGYMQSIYGGTIKEHKPDPHGEAKANEYLSMLESQLPAVSIRAKEDVKQAHQAEQVTKYAKAYFDPGVGMRGGINDTEALALVVKKYKDAFQKAYPKIWQLYKNDIIENNITPTVTMAKTVVKEYPQEKTDSSAEKVIGTRVPQPVLFNAQIQIEDTRSGIHQPAGIPAEQLTVSDVFLSDDRPLTKFGNLGQKSHTVAWTLTLRAIANSAKGQSLKFFLSYMLNRWQEVETQDWNKMINQKLDTSSGVSNAKNQLRLRDLQKRIGTNKKELEQAIEGQVKTDLEWVSFIQHNLSDYVEVYASAPLTTYKDGDATGHGEPDANHFLTRLEADHHTYSAGEDWKDKFTSEFWDKQTWVGPKDNGDNDETVAIYNKIIEKTELSAVELEIRNEILVKQLALKYLDIKWNAFMLPGKGPVPRAEEDMTRVLMEYEVSFAAAYPNIWKKYRKVIMEYLNTYTLSESIADRNLGQENMSFLLEPKHYEQGIRDIRAGDKEQNGSARYNQAKVEYEAGISAAVLRPDLQCPNGHPNAWMKGYNDYRNGYLAANNSPNAVVHDSNSQAYTDAYNHYYNGYQNSLTNNPAALPSFPGFFAYDDGCRDGELELRLRNNDNPTKKAKHSSLYD